MDNDIITSPNFPGIKSLGWLHVEDIPDYIFWCDAAGIPVKESSLYAVPTVISFDSTPVLVQSQDKQISINPAYKTELTFKSREVILPEYTAWVITDAQDQKWLVSGMRPHYGKLERSRSTSTPSSDPVTWEYKFSVPFPPIRLT